MRLYKGAFYFYFLFLIPKASPFRLIAKEGNKAANNWNPSLVSLKAVQSSKPIKILLYITTKDSVNTAKTKLPYTKYMVASSLFLAFNIAIIDNVKETIPKAKLKYFSQICNIISSLLFKMKLFSQFICMLCNI